MILTLYFQHHSKEHQSKSTHRNGERPKWKYRSEKITYLSKPINKGFLLHFLLLNIPLLFLINLLLPHFCLAQASESIHTDRSFFQLVLTDAQIISDDALSFFSSPLHFTERDWLITSGIAGTTILMMKTDESIQNFSMRNPPSNITNNIFEVSRSYGMLRNTLILSGTIYTVGTACGSDDIRITGRLMLESLFLSGITTMIIKYVAGRSRPTRGEGAWKFNVFEIERDLESFPSGHTSIAFAISTVLSDRLDNVVSTICLYSLATLTAASRISRNDHWFSDVVLGAVLGTVAGLHTTSRERERVECQTREQSRLSLSPTLTGFQLTYYLN